MKERVGTSAGVVALVFLCLHAFLPSLSLSEGKDVASSLKKPTAESLASDKEPTKTASVPLEGPWAASRKYLHREPQSAASIQCISSLLAPSGQSSTCLQLPMRELFGFEKNFPDQNLSALIATIQDPLHTRMSLEADRTLDAIQKGAFAAGWEMATQWLPWAAKSPAHAGEPANTLAISDPEKLPGLIVFRRKFNSQLDRERMLFVFVVGETPSAGINGFQFEIARRCIEALDRSPEMLVLGPNFSGSFPSLTELIKADRSGRSYRIQAGSVSNSQYAAGMLTALRPSKVVTFHGSTLPSVSFVKHFKDWARRQGFRDDQIGQLVEDGSGFSVGVEAAGARLQTFQYPRDIAQLRDAYSDVAFANPVTSDTKTLTSPQLTLKDTGVGESSFPVFSTSHTAVSQNVSLEQTVAEIKKERIRLLSVSATNVFDTLFLTNVLSKECPDVRVVLSGADLLFVQEAAQSPLRGVLAISPYPMFAEGFRWQDNSLRGADFADSDSIGEYNATLSLLAPGSDKSIALAPPSGHQSGSLASTWMLVLGQRGWAPVDLLDQDNPRLEPAKQQGNATHWFLEDAQRPLKSTAQEILTLSPPLFSQWTLLCLTVTIVAFAFCGRFLYLYLRPGIHTWSSLCSVDLGCVPLTRTAHVRYVCLAGCFSSVTFLCGVVLVPMLSTGSVKADWLLKALAGVAATSGLLIQCYLFWAMSKIYPKQMVQEDAASEVFVVASFCYRLSVLLLPIAGLFLWYVLCFQDQVRGPLLRYRAMSLDFAISPVWPLLFAAGGMLVVSFFHLRRLTWANRQRPMLEISLLDQRLGGQLAEVKVALERVLSGPAMSQPHTRIAGVAVIAGVIASLVLLFPRESLRSVEPISFDWLLVALFVPLGLLATSGFIRFALSWNYLKQLLSILNSLDVAHHFRKLPDFDGRGPIWVRSLRMSSLATSINSGIALHNLDLERVRLKLADQQVARLNQLPMEYWNSLSDCLSAGDRHGLIQNYQNFLLKAVEVSSFLTGNVLRRFWEEEQLGFVDAGVGDKEETAPVLVKGAAVGGGSSLAKPVESASNSITDVGYQMASKYVAMQFSVFIAYALRHIQNLLLCSVFAFVCLVLALNSFIFQTPEAISRLVLVGLIAGAAVVAITLAQIERNPIISRLSGTAEGTLGKDFYLQLFSYGALPVLTVLGTQMPWLGRLFSSLVQPAAQLLK